MAICCHPKCANPQEEPYPSNYTLYTPGETGTFNQQNASDDLSVRCSPERRGHSVIQVDPPGAEKGHECLVINFPAWQNCTESGKTQLFPDLTEKSQ